jgi:hypothetical protein
MTEYEWIKELPKTAVRPVSSGKSAETVELAEKLISSKETLKVVVKSDKMERRGFAIGLGRALRRRGHVLMRWEDSTDPNIWYLQARPLKPIKLVYKSSNMSREHTLYRKQ